MPQGDKSKYTDKQKRQARHIEVGYERRGISDKEAAARAWATVNAQDGGGKQSGSGRRSKAGIKKRSTRMNSKKSGMKKQRTLAHA